MTPKQKLKWAILAKSAEWDSKPAPPYPCENVDDLLDQAEEEETLYDARSEVRASGIETKLECPSSRHYESKAVARQMPDGSWVGWTYWYGGGKHAEPEAIDWISEAYDVECHEEQKMVTVQTFRAAAPIRYILADHICRHCSGGRILMGVANVSPTSGGNPYFRCSDCGKGSAAMDASPLCWCGFSYRGSTEHPYRCASKKDHPEWEHEFQMSGCWTTPSEIGVVTEAGIRRLARAAELDA